MARYTIKNGYRKSRRKPLLIGCSVVFVLFSLFTTFNLSVGAPQDMTIDQDYISAQAKLIETSPAAPEEKTIKHSELSELVWPAYGQAAYGVANDGVIAKSSATQPIVPIASLAKAITAVVIADKYPIAHSDDSILITFDEDDVALYNEYVAKNGVVLPVAVDQEISLHDALKALLLSSSNNITDSVVIDLFGSMEEYTAYANNFLLSKGITDTYVDDASGFSSRTVSTASDLVEIGFLYMKDPVLREIAENSNVELPNVGFVDNKNDGLNNDTVLGLKIGFTYEAKSTFIAADVTGESDDEISVAVVLGASTVSIAMNDTVKVLQQAVAAHKELSS